MRLSFITIHPQFIQSYLDFGVFASAQKKGLLDIDVINLRDFAVDRHGTIDDRAYGGGEGMVMRPEPLAAAVRLIKHSSPNCIVFYPCPHGEQLNHSLVAQLSHDPEQHFVFVCGRFGGVDQRFIDTYVDRLIRLGDFVISGVELASLVIADSILRLIPEVLGNQESALNDSFAAGQAGLLEHPQYTRPVNFEGQEVPEILRSGDHKAIESWKKEESVKLTRKLRPDLLV